MLTDQQRRQRSRRNAKPAQSGQLQNGGPEAVEDALQRSEQQQADHARRNEVQQKQRPDRRHDRVVVYGVLIKMIGPHEQQKDGSEHAKGEERVG